MYKNYLKKRIEGFLEFHELENYLESKKTPASGFMAYYDENAYVDSLMFDPFLSCGYFSITNITSHVDEDKILKYKEEIRNYVKNSGKQNDVNYEDGPCEDCMSKEYADSKYWNCTLGDGWISLEKIDNSKINGLNKYVILTYTTLPKYSRQLYDYVKNNINGKEIKIKDFKNNDKYYKKHNELAERNSKRVTYEFSDLAGLEIECEKDFKVYIKNESLTQPYIAKPIHHKWTNKFEKVYINNRLCYAYCNNSMINSNVIVGDYDVNSKKFLSIKKTKLQEINQDYSDFFMFVSGMLNKKIVISAKQQTIEFPITSAVRGGNKWVGTKYSLVDIKGIEKCFMSSIYGDNIDFEKYQKYKTIDELWNRQEKIGKTFFHPIITILK